MDEKKPDAALTMVSVTQFTALVELTVQRVYQLCQQDLSPRAILSVTSLDQRGRVWRLHSTLGYMSPMTFEKKRLPEERKLVA